jgi:hypothetical protein
MKDMTSFYLHSFRSGGSTEDGAGLRVPQRQEQFPFQRFSLYLRCSVMHMLLWVAMVLVMFLNRLAPFMVHLRRRCVCWFGSMSIGWETIAAKEAYSGETVKTISSCLSWLFKCISR